jgi:tRNA A37 threonylcarbamoyladenosine dehydratase
VVKPEPMESLSLETRNEVPVPSIAPAAAAASAPQPMTEQELETYRLHRRFDRMGRLIGDPAMKKLMNSHVMVIGLGGVGSWAAEALARSGIGELTLVDFDEICITNTNRQLHALAGLVGQNKAEVLAERMRKINPQAKFNAEVKFYSKKTADELFARKPDYVIDAIDNVTAKCNLIAYCRAHQIPIVVSTGSGGRMDPTQIRVADLAETEIDPLARVCRRILRQEYGFPTEGKFGVPAVFTFEPASMPYELAYDGGKGFRCVCPQGDNNLNTCDAKNIIMGNAPFATGAFGLACASHVVRDLIQGLHA